MMNFLRKHMRKIFIVTIIAFLGGTFVGGGAYLFGPAKDYGSAVNVNGSKIQAKLFASLYRVSADMYKNAAKESPTPEQLQQIKVQTMQAIVQDEIFYQQAQKYKISVSDAELKNDIQNSALFRNSSQKFDSNMYYGFLKAIDMLPKEYENLRKKQIAGEKLKILLASAIKISNSEFEAAAAGGSKMTKEEMIQIKGNTILNEWYADIIKNSTIITNDTVFSQI
jgi:hypothetical protein